MTNTAEAPVAYLVAELRKGRWAFGDFAGEAATLDEANDLAESWRGVTGNAVGVFAVTQVSK